MKLFLISISLFYASSLIAKEVNVTSLLSGLYFDKYQHYQEYKTELSKKKSKYQRKENRPLKYDMKYMIDKVSKVNFKKTIITNISNKKKSLEFYVDSTILGLIIELHNTGVSKNITVRLFDPNGRLVVHDSQNYIEVLDQASSSLIKIKAPIYGKWKLEFSKNSNITGQISAITPIKLYDFSFLEIVIGRHGSMFNEIKKPKALIGSKSKITLFGEKLYDKEGLKVKFIDLSTGKIKNIDITGVYNAYEIHLKRATVVSKIFDIQVEGKDINGFKFMRVWKRPFSNY